MRDRRFNPQRFLKTSAPTSLVDERIAAIAESDQLRRSAAFDRDRRRRVFDRIARANRALAEYVGPGPHPDSMSQMAVQLAENDVANGRDWFVGLHTVDRLEQMRNAIR